MKIKTPATGQSIAFFTCEKCGCALVPFDKGAVLFDAEAALDSATTVVFSCTSCFAAMDSAYPLFSSKDLSEFFNLIAT